jgi:hypothetical protein
MSYVTNITLTSTTDNTPDLFADPLSAQETAGRVAAYMYKAMSGDTAMKMDLQTADQTSLMAAAGTLTLSSSSAGDTVVIGGVTLTEIAFGATPTSAQFANGGGTSGPNLASAANFAVIANSTITNTGNTVLTGDLALSPGTSVTGFPPGTVVGTQHVADGTAATAQSDASAAYTDLAGRTGAIDKSGIDLGTLTLIPGLYKYTSSAQLTGTLTLDAQGAADAIWIFQIGSTLTTASSSVVTIINGGTAGNVYWQVGSSATLGTSTTFKGTIIANASITATTSTSVSGRLIALTGAVTLDTNAVSKIAAVTPTGGDVLTAQNLLLAINANTAISGLVVATRVANVVTVTAKDRGAVGNYLPLNSTGGITKSGSFLTGGVNRAGGSFTMHFGL